MCNVIVIGWKGLIGHNVVEQLIERNVKNVFLYGKDSLDISNKEMVMDILCTRDNIESTIINCAAITDPNEHKMNLLNVNTTGVENLAIACANTRSRLISISSDYVFKNSSEIYKEEDLTTLNQSRSENNYTISKLKAEYVIQKIPCESTIVRTSWVYGAGYSKPPRGFVTSIVRDLINNKEISIKEIQIGQPTLAKSFARSLVKYLIEYKKPYKNTIHIVGDQTHSRYTWANRIEDLLKNCPEEKQITFSKEYIKRENEYTVSNILSTDTVLCPTVKNHIVSELKELKNQIIQFDKSNGEK